MSTHLRYLAAIAEARTGRDLEDIVADLEGSPEAEALAVHVQRRARMLAQGPQEALQQASVPMAVQERAEGRVWLLPADVVTMRKRPTYYCPDHPELAGELVDVWEVGLPGDRKLRTEMVCMKCLRLIGTTDPATAGQPPETARRT